MTGDLDREHLIARDPETKRPQISCREIREQAKQINFKRNPPNSATPDPEGRMSRTCAIKCSRMASDLAAISSGVRVLRRARAC